MLGFEPGATYWFSITVLYGDGTKLVGNSVAIAIPEDVNGSEGEASEIAGYVDGDYVMLSWETIDSAAFQGYKVAASENNPNPKYPEDGYI